jgi:hypothetical protein
MGNNLMFWNLFLAQQRQIKLQKEANRLAAGDSVYQQYKQWEQYAEWLWAEAYRRGYQDGLDAANKTA